MHTQMSEVNTLVVILNYVRKVSVNWRGRR